MTFRNKIYNFLKKNKNSLVNLSKKIHDNPELGEKEYFAVEKITDFLEKQNFTIEKEIGGMDTAFSATLKGNSKGPTVAFLAEYDALPEIGHACGHNLIAMGSVGAGFAFKSFAGDFPGEIKIIGTPAEETRGGKVDLLKAGVFEDIDVAMMFHPGFENRVDVISLAVDAVEFVFKGKSAHAASEPEEGINALDALIQTFNSINALREHLKEDVRIHGIIKEGGQAPNIVPEKAVGEFYVRSLDRDYLDKVTEKVYNCAKGAALATGCELEIRKTANSFDNMITNKPLARIFKKELKEAGVTDFESKDEGLGSIDMGNISQKIPAIHPVLAITDERVPAHTRKFAELTDSKRGYNTALTAAKSLASTAYKIMNESEYLEEIKEYFNAK